MQRRASYAVVCCTIPALAGCAAAARHTAPRTDAPTSVARGVVYEDRNGNGQRDAGERGLRGVCVSNGRAVVATDADGRYQLPVEDEMAIFVIKPRGWATFIDALHMPRFAYVHKPAGSPPLRYGGVPPTGPLPAALDFPLRRQREPDRFEALLFGDTQPRNLQEVDYLSRDVIEPLAHTSAAFGVVLGDIVFDDLALFDPLNRALAHVGVPLYYVLGNHDMDYHAPDDAASDDVFERVYGAPYYAFNYGRVHFIVLDDVVWEGRRDDAGAYHGGLGERQLEFVKNDLAHVPPQHLVVLLMHIPLVEIREREALFALLADRPHVTSFSAHDHLHRHWFLGAAEGWHGPSPHVHTTLATTCGSWWQGAPDETGVPHATMSDGGPNGWCVASFDGHDCKLEFRAARRPPEYQMNIYAPDIVPATSSAGTEVLVNVFAGSQRSQVEMRVAGGVWAPLAMVQRPDPALAALKEQESQFNLPGRKLPQAVLCPHLWRGTLPAALPAGTHTLEIRTTDMYGHTYASRRLIRVE